MATDIRVVASCGGIGWRWAWGSFLGSPWEDPAHFAGFPGTPHWGPFVSIGSLGQLCPCPTHPIPNLPITTVKALCKLGCHSSSAAMADPAKILKPSHPFLPQRSPCFYSVLTGEGNGNSLQYSCLGNLMNRGAWWATVHGVAKSWTQWSTHTANKVHTCFLMQAILIEHYLHFHLHTWVHT